MNVKSIAYDTKTLVTSKLKTNLPMKVVTGLGSKISTLPAVTYVPRKYRRVIRNKAIERARTRIVIAGRDPLQFSQEDLEIVVREEEDKIKSSIKEKGLLAVLAFFGLHFFS
jgi:hypothetical protein